jgi:uncharacterized protein (TIGR02246 family)
MSKKNVVAGEQRWLEAFNGGDASGVAQMYAADARLLAPGSDVVQGRADIESFIKEFIQTGAKLSFDMLTVHETADLCASVSRYTMDFPADSGMAPDQGKFIEIWKRQTDGSWLIAEDIFNSNEPAPTA